MIRLVTILALLVAVSTSCANQGGVEKAKSLIKEQKFERAIKVLEKDKSQESQQLLVYCYLYTGALLVKDNLAMANSQDLDPSMYAKMYDKEKFDQARERFNKALAIDPNNTRAMNLIKALDAIEIMATTNTQS